MLGGGVDAATLVAALGAGPPPPPPVYPFTRKTQHRHTYNTTDLTNESTLGVKVNPNPRVGVRVRG